MCVSAALGFPLTIYLRIKSNTKPCQPLLSMETYNQIQSFKCDMEMKLFFAKMKKDKINVSKFIRECIEKNKPAIKVDKRRKPTMNDLKLSLNNIF